MKLEFKTSKQEVESVAFEIKGKIEQLTSDLNQEFQKQNNRLQDTEDNQTAYEAEFQRIRMNLEIEPGPIWLNIKDKIATRPKLDRGLFGNSRQQTMTGQSISSEYSPVKIEAKDSYKRSDTSPNHGGFKKPKSLKANVMM